MNLRDMVNVSYEAIPQFSKFARAVKLELDCVKDREDQFLRSSTGLSLMIKDLGQQHGREYFRFLFSDALHLSSHLGGMNRKQVMNLAKDIIHRMVCSLDEHAPFTLRLCCAYILDKFQSSFPLSTHGTTIVVGGAIILRIMCPALIKPELMGFDAHTSQTLPNAILLAKLLQLAMRGATSDAMRVDLHDADDFIQNTKGLMDAYLRKFPATEDDCSVGLRRRLPSTTKNERNVIIHDLADHRPNPISRILLLIKKICRSKKWLHSIRPWTNHNNTTL